MLHGLPRVATSDSILLLPASFTGTTPDATNSSGLSSSGLHARFWDTPDSREQTRNNESPLIPRRTASPQCCVAHTCCITPVVVRGNSQGPKQRCLMRAPIVILRVGLIR